MKFNNKNKNVRMNNQQSDNKVEILDKIKERQRLSNKEVNDVEYDDLKKEVLKYKELYKKVKKELNELERTTEEKIKQKIGYVRKEYSELEKENTQFKKEKEQLLDVVSRSEKEILRLSDELNALIDIKHDLKAEKEKVFMLQDLIDYKFSKIENIDVKIDKINLSVNDSKRKDNEIEKLINDKLNFKLRFEIENKEKEILSNENIQLKQRIDVLTIENDSLRENFTSNYKNKITFLINCINEDNWSEFSNSFTLFKHYNYYHKKALAYLKEDLNTPVYLFGYFNKEKGVFTSINGDEFTVAEIQYKGQLVSNVPVKAYISENDENEVVIDRIYNDLDTYKTEMQLELEYKKKHSDKIANKMKKYHNVGNEKILFITALNGNKCKNNISKYGFETEWIDPNDTSIEVIRGKLHQSDLVVVYPKYCTHSVTNIVDNNQFNVLYCYSFNEELLLNDITNKIYELRKSKSDDMC